MNAEKILAPALLALGLFCMEQSVFAQAPAAPPALPPGAAPDAAADPKMADDRAPLRAQDDKPAPAPAARPAATDKASPEPAAAPPTFLMPAEEPRKEEPAPPKSPPKPHLQHWSIGLGFTGGVVESAGYDVYSKNDALPMLSIFGTYTPWATRPLSLHLVLQGDYGGSGAKARGADASLDMLRLGLGLEGRYQPISRMALFVRAMPAAVHLGGTIQDPYLNATLNSGSWTFAADVTGGAAARIGAIGHPDLPSVSFWISLDMGYRFAAPSTMRVVPGNLTDEDAGRRFGEVTMPALDLSGFLSKLAFSVSF